MPVFHLQTPAALAALPAVALLAWLWTSAVRRSAAAEKALTGAAEGRSANYRRGALRAGALALVVLGLSGPKLLTGAAGANAPVIFVLDVSASMMADDVPPTRLAAGRQAAERVAGLLRGSPMGLVLAGADPVVACPPTQDREAFLMLLATADESRLQYGTDLGPAVEAASRVLTAYGGIGAIVLISDGEDHGPTPAAAFRLARARGADVHTVTVGSVQGVPVAQLPVAAESGPGARTQARPEAMAAWAADGGGRAWMVGPDRQALPAAAADVLSAKVRAGSARWHGRGPGLEWLCYAAAAVLLAADLVLKG